MDARVDKVSPAFKYSSIRFFIERSIVVGYTFLAGERVRVFRWDPEENKGFIEVLGNDELLNAWLEIYVEAFKLEKEKNHGSHSWCWIYG